MCGILGGNCKNWNYEAALKSITHRGPDAQKITRFKEFALGFARLSIIDLSKNAMQPMVSEDGNYSIVFNGEIYDYLKLKKQLLEKGYHFKTQSDTEVLLNAFIEWGEDMVKYIDGIFAIAVMDIKEGKIHLFRDRSGIKPLYYYYDGKRFGFASELKAIVEMCAHTDLKVDNTALYDFYTYCYIPAPKTMYKNVFKLKPAHHLIFDIKAKKILSNNAYWKVKVNVNEGEKQSEKQLAEIEAELRYHMDNIIARQVVSDVPVGTFLSGGVDSSIVTAVTKKYIPDVSAYTIGFRDRYYDESKFALQIAEILGVDCNIKKFEIRDFRNLYSMLPQWYDEPYADTSAFPSYLVSKFAKESVTVVLTGDGGDEIFGGYLRYKYALEKLDARGPKSRRLSDLYVRYESRLNKIGIDGSKYLKEDLAMLATMYHPPERPNMGKLRKKYNIPKDYDDFWYFRQYYHKELPPITRIKYMDYMTYLPDDILTKVDRVSMSNSLEARVPLLDKEMVEFAFSLNQQQCNPNGELKGIFKRAYKDVIPMELLDRSKVGFCMPSRYLKITSTIQEKLASELWSQ